MAKLITQADVMKMLDTCYDKALHGINKVSPPIEQFANEYVRKAKDPQKAAKKSNCKMHYIGIYNWFWWCSYIACQYSGEHRKCIICSDKDDSMHSIFGRI